MRHLKKKHEEEEKLSCRCPSCQPRHLPWNKFSFPPVQTQQSWGGCTVRIIFIYQNYFRRRASGHFVWEFAVQPLASVLCYCVLCFLLAHQLFWLTPTLFCPTLLWTLRSCPCTFGNRGRKLEQHEYLSSGRWRVTSPGYRYPVAEDMEVQILRW